LNGQGHARFGIPLIDSLVNFNDHYFAGGFDSNGNPVREWYTNTVGNPPQMHGTTTINAPVVPVSLDLRNFDGSPRFANGHRLFSDATPFVQPVIQSPVFQNYSYSSSDVPTQFSDAVQRAQYWSTAKPDWHTLLAPSVEHSWLGYFRGRSETRQRAIELLNQLGLGHRLTHRPNQLSGGERQRVAIARALMNRPRILFADEPTGNLDADTGRQIMAVLEKLHREQGQTIVMVTHDRALARTADRVLVLREGRLDRAES
jgi:ABC-type sugar transport system ATPase subunit